MIETKLDPKEEREYSQLRALGQRLHIPIPEAFWKLEVFDKKGQLLQSHKQRSHSWTRNAYNYLFTHLAGVPLGDDTFGAGLLSLKETGADVKYQANNLFMIFKYDGDMEGTVYGYRAAGANDAWGILVGSGTNAESFEDFVLQTPIAEGAGAGQLNHAASEAHNYSYDALVFVNELLRYLNNNSGGNVSVNEVCLAARLYNFNAGSNNIVMTRDKLGATVTVPDTGQCKVTYTIQLTYPA